MGTDLPALRQRVAEFTTGVNRIDQGVGALLEAILLGIAFGSHRFFGKFPPPAWGRCGAVSICAIITPASS